MKHLMIALFVLSLGACAEESGRGRPSRGESAEAPAPAAKTAAPAAAPKAAIFLVGEELTPPKIQALGAALAGLDGILAAKPDPAAGTFVVTFSPGQVTPDAIGARLLAATPAAEFMGLTAPAEIPADHDDCGECPYKDECASAH
ncbi:MAG: hypothetical protein ABIK09_15475 [Pseudomonadota bacterium]